MLSEFTKLKKELNFKQKNIWDMIYFGFIYYKLTQVNQRLNNLQKKVANAFL